MKALIWVALLVVPLAAGCASGSGGPAESASSRAQATPSAAGSPTRIIALKGNGDLTVEPVVIGTSTGTQDVDCAVDYTFSGPGTLVISSAGGWSSLNKKDAGGHFLDRGKCPPGDYRIRVKTQGPWRLSLVEQPK